MSQFITRLVGGSSGGQSSDEGTARSRKQLDASLKHERRRAQVRNAQRKHRERRESYLTATTNSVNRLRHLNRGLIDENAMLIDLLRSNNLPIPSSFIGHHDFNDNAHPSPPRPFQLRIVQDPIVNNSFIELQSLSSTSTPKEVRVIPVTSNLPGAAPPPAPHATHHASPEDNFANAVDENYAQNYPHTHHQNETQNYDLNFNRNFSPDVNPNYNPNYNREQLEYVGTDFVLALEHPCMSHFDEVMNPDGTHNHMMAHQVLESCPKDAQKELYTQSSAYQQSHEPSVFRFSTATALNRQSVSAPKVNSWTTAEASLNRLLSLSACFQLHHGEITPVQAWFKIVENPRFEEILNSGKLLALKRVMMENVKCYGFGSVMDEHLFEATVANLLVDDGPFDLTPERDARGV